MTACKSAGTSRGNAHPGASRAHGGGTVSARPQSRNYPRCNLANGPHSSWRLTGVDRAFRPALPSLFIQVNDLTHLQNLSAYPACFALAPLAAGPSSSNTKERNAGAIGKCAQKKLAKVMAV